MEKRWGTKIYSEKIKGFKILGFSEENTPGGYSPLKMIAPLHNSHPFLTWHWDGYFGLAQTAKSEFWYTLPNFFFFVFCYREDNFSQGFSRKISPLKFWSASVPKFNLRLPTTKKPWVNSGTVSTLVISCHSGSFTILIFLLYHLLLKNYEFLLW